MHFSTSPLSTTILKLSILLGMCSTETWYFANSSNTSRITLSLLDVCDLVIVKEVKCFLPAIPVIT